MKFQISSENNFYLIMEYCNEGNLDKYLVRRKFNIPE
jgi:serine/threonine protein kinase